MVKSLAEYQAEVTRSYEPARQAIQNQINALAGQESQGLQSLQNQYKLDQQTLERNRDTAAEAASLAAAGNGGSFGGQANIANRKYYAQTFAPAQSQLQTNFDKSRGNYISQINQNRMSLESQMANLASEAHRYGISRYDAAVAQDKQYALEQQRLALQRRQLDQDNRLAQYLNQVNQLSKENQRLRGSGFDRSSIDSSGKYVDRFGNQGIIRPIQTTEKRNGRDVLVNTYIPGI
jgi:hypothetical protein